MAAGAIGIGILVIFGMQRWRMDVSSSPTLTMSNKPFGLVDIAVQSGSSITFDGKTTAPDNTLFQVVARRELVAKQQNAVKTSMLPHVGDVFYEHSVKLESSHEPDSPNPLHFFGRVKDGRIKFKVQPFHPYIQAFGQTLDSDTYAFDKFNVVIFYIKISGCGGCKPKRLEELTDVSWIDFKEMHSVPVQIYTTSPTKEEMEQIESEVGQ